MRSTTTPPSPRRMMVFDGTAVEYHHIVGLQGKDKTIRQVQAKPSRHLLLGSPPLSRRGRVFELMKGEGDGTVPLLSATRRSGGSGCAPGSNITIFVSDIPGLETSKWSTATV
ncbi:MAG: hypothetical protein R2856_24150 [Caldilineaceae bacterium]